MFSIQSLVITLTTLLLSTTSLLGFSPQSSSSGMDSMSSGHSSRKSFASSSALNYVRDPSTPPAIAEPMEKAKVAIQTKRITAKPKVQEIKSLDELQYFLEEDDERPVAIKFVAPWCKTCQRLRLHFDRLALEMGDTIQNRQKVEGPIRFASIEYGSETSRLITQTLQIRGVPTLQLYSGIRKVWEENGATSVRGLKEQLISLQLMSTEELLEHAEAVDDGILQSAIEDGFFDGPDFLNEEW